MIRASARGRSPFALLLVFALAQFGAPINSARASADNAALIWNEAALQGVRDSGGQGVSGFKLGPPMVARALAVVHTCIYGAWAAYDQDAVGTQLGSVLRRPVTERTASSKHEAISFAAYRALVDVLPRRTDLYRARMAELGYDYNNTTTDISTPAGVGNVACAAVLDFRHGDGSNQLGNLQAGPYSDYTGYQPANTPMDLREPFRKETVNPNRWQPLTYVDAFGAVITPKYIAPHWGNVTPFAMTSGSQFRSPDGPAVHGSPQYLKQALEVLSISATLDDRQKMISEYWTDGPESEFPPGHWNVFAQIVSRRDGHSLDQDVKMFFALTNAVMDAGIAAWDNKRSYDSVRPITAVRYLFDGLKVPAWAGPGQGTQLIDGGTWLPYQPTWFPSPPFAEYSSGHSAFSAAAAEVLRLFTGSDAFGASVTLPARSSRVEIGITPATDIVLSWPTFSSAADEAGISRRYGGIHFEQGDLDGRGAGRLVGAQAWEKASRLFLGTP